MVFKARNTYRQFAAGSQGAPQGHLRTARANPPQLQIAQPQMPQVAMPHVAYGPWGQAPQGYVQPPPGYGPQQGMQQQAQMAPGYAPQFGSANGMAASMHGESRAIYAQQQQQWAPQQGQFQQGMSGGFGFQQQAGMGYGQQGLVSTPQGYAPAGFDPRRAAIADLVHGGQQNPYGFQGNAAVQYDPMAMPGQNFAAPVYGAQDQLAQARMAGQGVQVAPLQHFGSRADEFAYAPDGQYNPMGFGGQQWRNGADRPMPDVRNRIFSAAGQINANDSKGALEQIVYLMQSATKQSKHASFMRRGQRQLTEYQRQVLAATLQDNEGFQVLGQELLLPIKEIVDYEGWTRRVLRTRRLGQGELFRMAKDIRSTAWVIGQDGQGVEARQYGRYVTPTEFKIGSFPTVDIQEVYQVNYDILDRAQDTARQEIELEEDKRTRALIDVMAQTVNTVTAYPTLGIGAFEDVRLEVEQHRLVVEKFLINRQELSDIVKTMSSAVDPVTERELILAGYIGSIMNAMIITSAGTGVEEVIPAGTFYAVTGPDYLGELGIRVELFSEPFNMFAMMRMVKGYCFGEIIGLVGPNPRAAAKGVKS